MRRRSGFTFFELMIVIAIVALAGTLSMARFRGTYENLRLKKAGRDVVGVMRMARNTAVLRETSCEVRFDCEADTYQIVLYDKQGNPIEPEKKKSGRRSSRKKAGGEFQIGDDASGLRKLPDGIHFPVISTAAPLTEKKPVLPRVIYYADGSATPATITVQDEHERAVSVRIYRATGMARVEKGVPVEPPKTTTLYYGPKRKKRA